MSLDTLEFISNSSASWIVIHYEFKIDFILETKINIKLVFELLLSLKN